ncbi:LuxR C-terminal-related transcriptional regulator [Rubneribacter sp.]|nr:helix-turn-helix transcriptional regulator [Candidatus Rubneribacter avistercoris]
MEIGFYFYTILIMLVCIASGTISLSAYFVARRRPHLLAVFFFLFYFLDLALIFQYEYLGQNVDYSLDAFYLVDNPALKTFFALGTLESLWLIVCDYLDERRPIALFAPAACFIALSGIVVTALPEGPFKQWLFYSLRQLFLFWCLSYSLHRYRTATTEVEKIRLRRQRTLFLVTLGLTFCILAEDVLMILIWQPNDSTDASLFPLYISERNFSENFLMLAFAFYSLRESATTLRLRFKEPPAAKSPTVLQHIDDLAPAYCARHGLTMREQEVLELVLQGKDNQNIASELQLALGTVKAHVHNILKKTGHPDRQALIQDFWRE